MKAILDTNVIMSGIFWSGHARNILVLLDEKRFENICSKDIAQEYIDTAEKLKKKLNRNDHGTIDELIEIILMNSLFFDAVKGAGPECRDPKDQMFLDLAVTTNSKYIVSGDKDLLVLTEYPGGAIIKPKPFLDLFHD